MVRREFDRWGGVGEAMIANRTLEVVEGTQLTAPSAMGVSSALRSYDGGLPCGDVASVLPLSSGRTALVVIDVAGHGTARAPLSRALDDVMTASLRRDGSPALALNCAHQLLLASGDELPYAVAFVALVNPVFRTIVYASAGHDVAFTLADDGRIRHLAQTATMLGLPLTNNACDAVFVLDPKVTLVIASDGISDSRPAGSDQFFGALGTAGAVTRSLFNGSDPAQAVLDAACEHAGGRQADDVAVLVTRLGPWPAYQLRRSPVRPAKTSRVYA